MAELSVQRIVLTGLNPTYAAAAGGGDNFLNDGRTVIHVKNGGAGPITVTADGANPDQWGVTGNDHDAAVSVPNAGERIIGPFRRDRFNDANSKVNLAYSGVTSVTIAVLQLP